MAQAAEDVDKIIKIGTDSFLIQSTCREWSVTIPYLLPSPVTMGEGLGLGVHSH
jgi:formylmethanofuran dehydrogenase subunit E-like metal-binding protein